MARLTARIVELERPLPTGLEDELEAMSDEELERRLEAVLSQMSEADVLAMAQEYSHFFTPKVLEEELARWRELHGGSCARENENEQSKLLGVQDGERLDTGTRRTTAMQPLG